MKRLEGEGMPIEGNRCHRGSLFIHFIVDYPSYISEEQVQALRTVFNVPVPTLPSEVESHRVFDASPEMFGSSIPEYNQSREVYDSSEDDGNQRNGDCPVQ